MHKDHRLTTSLFLFLNFLIFWVASISGGLVTFNQSSVGESSFAPKAFIIRYWNNHIENNITETSFLLSRSSPLSAFDAVNFAKLVSDNTISAHLSDFCSSANLLCLSDQLTSSEKPKQSKTFRRYFNKYTYRQPNLTDKLVEPGLFFRESMLKNETVITMPDIEDIFIRRSFLARSILSRLPFLTSKLGELKEIFHIKKNSSMESMMESALSECEGDPEAGEIKKCVVSAEDMIDFAISVLGKNIVVRTTDSGKGSKQKVMIDHIKEINQGYLTRTVSCHQILFPYVLHYCHSVLKVRVYESDKLDRRTKTKINHVVAICHSDTSSWSSYYEAFILLGPGPGKIEICHWIIENSIIWTTAN